MTSNTAAPGPSWVLHLGLGSFHRAHQAYYMHRLAEAGDRSWFLASGNIRPDMVETIEALRRQNGAYTLVTVSPDGEPDYKRITSLREVLSFTPDLAPLLAIGSRSQTRVISFTVTEEGYYLDAQNQLALGDPDIEADLAADDAPHSAWTIYGALTAILRERMRRNSGPITLLSCDNLRRNGDRFRHGLLQFVDALGDTALKVWLLENTSSPNCMVDRITPRPPLDLRQRVQAETGWGDAAPVMSESFLQWVIEELFRNGRPPWESVGVEMVQSVAPYEEAKIRILNASHSCIAWAGTLLGYRLVSKAAKDPRIRGFAHDYVINDVLPCLQPSPLDLHTYCAAVLERFCNDALPDTNERIVAASFAKVQGFIAPTLGDRLTQNASITSVAVLPALFFAFLRLWRGGHLPYSYEEQASNTEESHKFFATSDPVLAFCGSQTLWGSFAGDDRFVAAVRAATERVAAFTGPTLA